MRDCACADGACRNGACGDGACGACGFEGRALVGALAGAKRPQALQSVVQRGLQAVRGGVPELHGAVLGPCDNDGQLRVEQDGADVVPMAFQRLHAGLGLVVPHLGQFVVRA